MKTAKEWLEQRCHSLKGVTPETIREIQQDACAGCRRDSERLDWMEKCLDSHIIGRDSIEGDWFITSPHRAIVTQKNKSLRDAIDAAIEGGVV